MALCALMLSAFGCKFRERGQLPEDGYITERFPAGTYRIGEWEKYTADPGVYRAVLYRSKGRNSYNYPTTEALLQLYRSYRSQGDSEVRSAGRILSGLNRNCSSISIPYERGFCYQATAPWMADNFLFGSLVPVVWDRTWTSCIAVTVDTNYQPLWSYEEGSSVDCRPN